MEGNRPSINNKETDAEIRQYFNVGVLLEHIPRLEGVLRFWGSIGRALAPKFSGGNKTHEISKTRKMFGEIHLVYEIFK